MFDLVIANGVLVSNGQTFRGNIAIRNGKVAQITPGAADCQAQEIYDAGGRYVLPGLIDAHVHFRDPGNVHKEGFENGSRAAALGGITTVLIMPTDNPLTSDTRTFAEKIALGSRSHVDFGLQALVGHDFSPLDALSAAGCASFEIFFGDIADDFLMASMQSLLSALQAIKATGRVAGITPMMQSITGPLTDEMRSMHRNDPINFARSRPPEAESLGVRLACEAAVATGCPIHLRQMSSKFSVDVLAAYREVAPDLISAEVLPQNLFLTERKLVEVGPFAKMSPPLRREADLSALWEAIDVGLIDMVVTDHAPHLRAEKEAGRRSIWEAPSGIPGLETLLPLMLTAWSEGRLSIKRMVEILCEAPARRFGLYPRKGVLLPGSDADIVVVDPSAAWQLDSARFATKARYSPFDGMEVQGQVDLVLLRGKRVAEKGKLVSEPFGAFVPALPLG